MKIDWGEIRTIQIDEYYKLNPDKLGTPIQIIFGARESGKTYSILVELRRRYLYKKYRTRISHLTHTRRRICKKYH